MTIDLGNAMDTAGGQEDSPTSLARAREAAIDPWARFALDLDWVSQWIEAAIFPSEVVFFLSSSEAAGIGCNIEREAGACQGVSAAVLRCDLRGGHDDNRRHVRRSSRELSARVLPPADRPEVHRLIAGGRK